MKKQIKQLPPTLVPSSSIPVGAVQEEQITQWQMATKVISVITDMRVALTIQ